MSSARDQQIRALYLAALERPRGERASFVAQLSGTDEDLKRSVERLLSGQDATDIGARDDAGEAADLAAGTHVGQYRIEGLLGRGGMGVVYRATDTKLQRPVAIKFLAAAVSDVDAHRRFEQEAKTTSALNHPHIVTTYDVGEHDGHQYIVSELVDGGTLDGWARAARRSWRQSVELLTGIADALAAAHAAGVLHRDVKPGNILIGNGYAKLADFGLAKLFDASSRNGASQRTSRRTRAGVVVGTVAYMSPEQATGQPLDARSDVFSFGVVLYELVAGRRPFDSANELEVLKAIAHAAPAALPDGVPELLRIVLDKALEKEPGDRYQTMQDLVADLKRVTRRATSSGTPASKVTSKRRLRWLIAAGLAIALIAAVPTTVLWPERPLAAPPLQFEINAPGYVGVPVLSPDGSQLAYVATDGGMQQIWIRPIGAREARALPGTEGGWGVFWSPDSRSLAFFTDDGLQRINTGGGGAQRLAGRTSAAYRGDWGSDGTLLFSSPAPPAAVAIGRVDAAGGALTLLTEPDPARSEDGHVVPRWLPDGEHFIYLAARASAPGATLYLGSASGGAPRALFRIEESQAAGRGDRILNLAYNAGYILYFRDLTVMAQPFDADSLELRGEPRALLENVGEFSVAGNLLVYRDAGDLLASRRKLSWYDRAGRPLGDLESPTDFRFPVLSPDGQHVAVSAPGPESPWDDVWTIDVERSVRRRLTSDQASDHSAVWSPDGERLAFASARDAAGDFVSSIYASDVSGASIEQPLFSGPRTTFAVPHDWSRDGRHILFHRLEGVNSAFWVLPLASDEPAYSLLEFSFPVGAGRFSPDGRWLAYAADESDGFQIVVQPFPNVGGDKQQVSTRGGYNPRWRDDGRELFYVARDGTIVAVDVGVDASGRFRAGEERALFKTTLSFPTTRSTFDYLFDVAPGGERFLLNEAAEPERNAADARATETLHVIVNWASVLRE